VSSLKFSTDLSFDQIAQAIDKDDVWLAAAFYGQVWDSKQMIPVIYLRHVQAKFTEEELKRLCNILGVSEREALSKLGSHWWPNRGLGPVPPRDPVLYRLFEVRLFSCYIRCDLTHST
jgi:cyanate lyase